MQLSVPRLLGMVAGVEAVYLAIRGWLYFARLPGDMQAHWAVAVHVIWPLVFAAGAYALWLPGPPSSLWTAVLRSLLIWTVIVVNLFLLVDLAA